MRILRKKPLYNVEDPPTESAQLPNYSPRFDVDDPDDHVITHNCQKSAISVKQQRDCC